ncbi:hypothetical protein ACLMAJ_19495 [Nocardia sp. KC 131]|uniref:hypothetical protein n=1 Tax=Nocardia arseniciresistens TaxID=3392119 RepID=UPI00398E5847
MKIDGVDELTAELERVMHGLNYAPSFGLLRLPAGLSLGAAQAAVIATYPQATFPNPILSDVDTLWDEIDYGFHYRGDTGSGLTLSLAEETRLQDLQERYRNFARSSIGPGSVIYTGGFAGLPGYPVFWDFRYIVLNEDRNGLLLFGSASD